MANKIYYAVVDRNGWRELHVSAIREEVETLTAMSRKIPLHSNLLDDFTSEVKEEMKHYGAIEVTK